MIFSIQHKITANDGLNRFWAGVHWTKRKRWRDYWHNLVYYSLLKYPKKQFENRVHIDFFFDSNLDADGHACIAKAIIDSLVELGYLKNDNKKWVAGISLWVVHEEVEKGKIVVRINKAD